MSNKNLPLDEQLFTAEHWAPMPQAMLGLQFKDVTLKAKVGDFAEGTKFSFAVLLGDASALVLIDEKQEEHAFRLNLTVGEKLDVAELREPGEGHDDACDCGHDHH